MTGLLDHRRDVALPARVGEPQLVPPSAAEFAGEVLPRLAPQLCGANVELVYARWKPRVATTAAYRVELDGRVHHAVWRVHAGGKWSASDARLVGRGRLDTEGGELAVDVDVARGRLAFLFPADPDLPGAVRVFDAGRFARWFEEQALRPAWRVRRKHFTADLVRYRPASRAVVHLVVKLMGPGGEKERVEFGTRVLPIARASDVLVRRRAFEAAAGDTNPFPRLVASEERVGVLHEEWLAATCRASDDHGRGDEVGERLARLHATPVVHAPQLVRERGAEDLGAWFTPFAELSFAERPPERLAANTWTHGDFHPDCIATTAGGEARLFDADSLAIGDVREDFADWLGGALAASSASLAEALAPLAAGYGHGAPRADELAPLVARALERRAAGVLRRLEEDAVARAARLLERARTVLAEVCS